MTPLALAAPQCREITGFEQHAAHAPGLVVSDMHGTVESPAFLKDVVCSLLHSDHPVLLALEYPAAEQSFLDGFLRARHADTARSALLASPFWRRPTQDGRTSQAMLWLLQWVWEQHARGAPIRLLAFDSLPEPKEAAGSAAAYDARDAAMAVTVRQGLTTLSPREVPVIFTGNVHARKTQGLPFSGAPPDAKDAQPLGYRLKDRGFVHLGIRYSGGSIWICLQDHCGVQQGTSPGPVPSAFSIEPSGDPAYDAIYVVGPLTASPPAVPAGQNLP